MEQASLPLSFHCRNARLCLKKAAFCKKSVLFSDELSHLRKFETLVSSTIPSHPLFSISSKEKQVAELLDYLLDCRERIRVLETDSPLALETPPQSPILMSKRGKMPGSIRGIPPDSHASSRRPSLGAGDSPSKKQQSWGIWTANPQHDASQLGTNSSLGFGGLSPPSSRKRFLQRGKKAVAATTDKEPIVVPALPLRPSSADQRLQSMIGGCALVANQLHQINGKKHDTQKKAATEAESSAAAESKARLANIQTEGTSKRPLEWLLSSSQGHQNSGAQERAMTPPVYGDRDQKSPNKATQSFRFSPQFLEKRLKDRMAQIQRRFPDTDEDGSASSPAKVRMPSNRLTGDTLLNEEEQSSAEESVGHGASSSTLEMFAKHLNHGTDPSALTAGRLQRMSFVDQEEISTERSQVLSSTDDMWAKNLVPVVEQKLCDDMLRRTASQKATPRSSRKRNRKRGVLGVMDDVIRRAVDSDSALSNVGSPPLLASGQDSLSEMKRGCEIDASEQKGALHRLQSEGLEAKFKTLQELVGELRRCMEGFTARVEGEGERWQAEMQGLEKNMCRWRENAESEMVSMKKSLRDEMQKMMDEVRIGLIRVERLLEDAENLRQEPGLSTQPREEYPISMESIQRKMESLIANMKVDLLLELKEKVTSGMRRDLDVFELGVSKQFEGMHRDMESALAETEKTRRLEKQELDAFIDEKMEKRLSQRLEIVSGGKEKVIADMKNELRLLWVEVDMLSKGREEIKDTVDQLAHIAEEAKQSIGEEQNALKHENGTLKKQLQYFKKETMQVRADNEDFKKDIELEMEHIRSSLENIKADEQNMKTVLDRVMESEELARKKGEENNESAQERMLIMEKVEGISQLYLGGLEDVRSELLSFKLECQDRMEELEGHCAEIGKCQQEQERRETMDPKLPLEGLVLDGLESRVSHLESRLEQIGIVEDDRIRILAAMEKDREQTSVTLDHVASAAQKADEFVAEMVRSFSSELSTVMRQSHKIQENLAAERDMAVASAGEVKRMSEDMDRQMTMAMAVISEAQAKGHQIQEGLEKEISVLKGSIVLEKEATAAAAAHAADVASKANEALVQIHRMQSESFAMSEDIAEATGHAYMTYNKELESQLEDWKKMMLTEVTQARSLVEGMEEEKQRIQRFTDSCREEKHISPEEFEQHVKETEDAFTGLKEKMKELSATMESKSTRSQAESEDRVRHEIKELRDKVEEAFTRLEEATGQNERLDNDVSLRLQTADNLLQTVKNFESKVSETMSAQVETAQNMKILESKMNETMTAQVETAEKVSECCKKVRKLENMQLSTASSVEEVQASTGDLQKSASLWLQKYDAAARLLQDVEKRILTLESNSFSGGTDHRNDRLDVVDLDENMQPAQKERLINLHNELSGFVQRLKAHEGGGLGDDKAGTMGWSSLVDSRLVSLENKVAQVETETFSNLRLLDAKMEDFSVGVQTALEGASMAETKCSALGQELVKLFRMIATNRKDSPSRMMMMMEVTAGGEELNGEQQQLHQHTQKQQQPPSRTGRAVVVKGTSQTACNYCKKAATKGSLGESVDSSHNHVGLAEGYEASDVEQRSPAGLERSLKVCTAHDKQSPPQHHPTSREASPTFKLTRQQPQRDKEESSSLEAMWKRATSESRLLEGKLPITADERRMEAGKKLEGIQVSSGKPELQLTNIRLDGGKVHVNVSHRPPSSLTATRVMKRGDAMSAAQP